MLKLTRPLALANARAASIVHLPLHRILRSATAALTLTTVSLATASLSTVSPALAADLSTPATHRLDARAATAAVARLEAVSATRPQLKLAPNARHVRAAFKLHIATGETSPERAAKSFLVAHGPAFGVSATDFASPRTTRVSDGTIVRLTQTWRGLPVYGAQMVVRIADNGVVQQAFFGGSTQLDLDTTPVYTATDAALRAWELATGMPTLDAAPQNTTDWASLMILPRGKGRLVWAVRVAAPNPTAAGVYIYDAITGDLVGVEKAARFAEANVFIPPNPTEVRKTTQVKLTGLNSTGEGSTLENPWVECFNCLDRGVTRPVNYGGQTYQIPECTEIHTAEADADGNFLYAPVLPSTYAAEGSRDDAFAEVNMFYHVDAIYEYFRSLGLEELRQKQMHAVVNFQIPDFRALQQGRSALAPFDNAFFMPAGYQYASDGDRDMIVFGQGEDVDFSYDADVIYHEFTHAVVNSTSNLDLGIVDEQGYSESGLSLNEGFADYFAALFTDDPVVGDYVGSTVGNWYGGTSEGLRTIANDNSCPRNIIGEGHNDGLFWTGALWDIRNAFRKSFGDEALKDGLDRMMYEVLAGLPRRPSFADAADAVLAAIENEPWGEELLPIAREVFEQRGILPECDRVRDANAVRYFYIRGAAEITGYGHVPSPMQFKVTVPEGENAIVVQFVAAADGQGGGFGGSEQGMRLVARKAEKVWFDTEAYPFVWTADFDVKMSEQPWDYGSTIYSAQIGGDCLTPGDWYFSILNGNSSTYTVFHLETETGPSSLTNEGFTRDPSECLLPAPGEDTDADGSSPDTDDAADTDDADDSDDNSDAGETDDVVGAGTADDGSAESDDEESDDEGCAAATTKGTTPGVGVFTLLFAFAVSRIARWRRRA